MTEIVYICLGLLLIFIVVLYNKNPSVKAARARKRAVIEKRKSDLVKEFYAQRLILCVVRPKWEGEYQKPVAFDSFMSALLKKLTDEKVTFELLKKEEFKERLSDDSGCVKNNLFLFCNFSITRRELRNPDRSVYRFSDDSHVKCCLRMVNKKGKIKTIAKHHYKRDYYDVHGLAALIFSELISDFSKT
ncbi:MAG: hypothetical protein PHR00_01645 [Patescibacteria group bacterium]|nr:hypothetical protein [Patescibacteria group bacterium]